jgi:fibronectin-binding autotransporter adhesin
LLAAAGAASALQSSLWAANYTWATFTGSMSTWTDPANWTSAAPGSPAYPRLPGDSANIAGALSGGDLDIVVPSNVSVTTLTLGATGVTPFNIDVGSVNSGGGRLIFDPASTIVSVGTSGAGNFITAPIQLNGNLGIATASSNSLAIGSGLQMNGGNRTITNNLVGSTTLSIGGDILLYDATAPLTSRVLTLDGLGKYSISCSFVVGDGTTTGNTGTIIFGGNTQATQGYIEINSNNSGLNRSYELRRTVLMFKDDFAVGTGLLFTNTSAGNFMAEIQSDSDSRAIKAQVGVSRPLLVGGSLSMTLDNGILGLTNQGGALVNLLPASKSLTVNGNVFLWNANINPSQAMIFDGPGSTVVNGPVLNNNLLNTNSSPLTKRGTGELRLNNTSSTYSGSTIVQGGLLVFGGNGAWGNTGGAGAGIAVSSGGAIWYAPGTGDTAGFTAMLNEVLTSSTGALALPATESATTFNFSFGTLTNAAGMTIGAQGTVTYNGTITPGFGGYGWGGVGTLILDGNNRMTGGNVVRYANGGTVIVNGTHDYTGPTRIEGSILTTDQVRAAARVSSGGSPTLALSTVLQISSITDGGVNSALGASSNDPANLVFNGGTLRFVGSGSTDRRFSIGTLGGAIDSSGSGLSFTNVGANLATGSGIRTLTLTGSSQGSIAGTFSDSGANQLSLAKTGAGQWTLAGNNSYTGTTSVSGGTLSVRGTHTGGGTYTVGAGGTLGGDGTITAQLNVATLGALAPGASVGVLAVGSLSLAAANLNFEIDGSGADRVNVTSSGGLTLSGVSTFTISDVGGMTTGTYPMIDYAGTALGDLSSFFLATPSLSGFGLSLFNNTAATSIDLVVGPGTVVASWNVDSDGSWSVGSNWTGGLAPNGIDSSASFGTIITQSRTVTVDTPQTVGTMSFSGPVGYLVTGPGTVTMDTASGSVGINVPSGTHQVTAPIVLNDDLVVNAGSHSGAILTGTVIATGRTVTKTGAGVLQLNNVRAAALNVNEGRVLVTTAGPPNDPAGTSVVNSLSITPGNGAHIDLTNESLIIDYSGDVGTLVNDTREHLLAGRITSTAATENTRLGYGDNQVLGKASFAGQNVDASSILIKFTYGGDSDLDGDVDVGDLGALATNWQAAGVWTTGDFDYNGTINVNDLGNLATNWQAGVSSPLGPQSLPDALASFGFPQVSVPEPAVALLAPSLCSLRRPRRRR